MSFIRMSQRDVQNAVDSGLFPHVRANFKPKLISVKPVSGKKDSLVFAIAQDSFDSATEFGITEDVLKTQYYQTPADAGTFIFRQIPIVVEAYSVPFDVELSGLKGHTQQLSAGGFILKDRDLFYGLDRVEFEASYTHDFVKSADGPDHATKPLGTKPNDISELLASLKSKLADAEHQPSEWAISRTAMGQITTKGDTPVTPPFEFNENSWGSFAFKRDAWLAVAAVNALPCLIAELENVLDL